VAEGVVALLEVVRLGLVKIYQEKEFGQIWVLNPQQETGETSERLLVEDAEEVPA